MNHLLLAALLFSILPILSLAPQAPQGVPVSANFQAWADGNRDGRIGPDEIERAWRELLLPRLLRLLAANPEAARLVDVNGHGRVGADEIAGFRERIVRVAVLLPVPAEVPGGRPERGRRFLDELADVNGDGNVDPEEERQREVALGSPHATRSPIDKRLDANGNGRVEQAEIDQAFKTQERQDAEWAAMEREAAEATAREAAAHEAAARAATDKPTAAVQPATQPAAASTGTTAPAAATQAAPAAAATTTAPAASTTATATTATTSSGVSLEQVAIDEIFPVFASYYDDHPVGTAVLKNGTSAALENVKVELKIEKYMDAKKPCTAPTTIAAGASGKVELTTVFNDEVLQISEGKKALATITVSYTSGGKSESKDFVHTVSFLEQNAMTWDDDDRAAAFVTAKDPVIQQIRSAVVTNVDKAITAVDKNLRTAMAIHHLLVKYGLKY